MLEERSAKVAGLRKKLFWLYVVATLACLLAAIAVSLAFISASNLTPKQPTDDNKTPVVDTNNPDQTQKPEENDPGQTPTPEDPNKDPNTQGGDTVVIPEGSVTWVTAPGIASGTLVLVNNDNPYLSANAGIAASTMGGSIQIVNVKENRTSSTANLQVSANSVELSYSFVDMLCKMADAMVEACDNTTANLIVHNGFMRDTDPNSSELFTGLSTELRINDSGKFYQFKDNMKLPTTIREWVLAHCHEYGIIQRYPADKVTETGSSASVAQFRYVGKVHAKYMNEMNYCLEEYLTVIKEYNFNKRLDITVDEVEYSLYFVKEADATKGIPVPKNADYEISGNNIDGYVVLVTK